MTYETLHFFPRFATTSTKLDKTENKGTDNVLPSAKGFSLPFNVRTLPDGSLVGISASGDHAFFTLNELNTIVTVPDALPLHRQAELRSRFFLESSGKNPGTRRLLQARRAARRETISNGPSLHILVPTLQCAHSCQYCQVSRSLEDAGHTMSQEMIDAACDRIFESTANVLTVEFQGGDPLLRYDLVKYAVLRIKARNESENRKLRFVVASTLHQLTDEMCDFFKEYEVYLSTSIDGPAELHNRNRPLPGRDSYQRTLAGIELARKRLGHGAVAALMTTTQISLQHPEAIVDEYVRLGFSEIFLRPLSSYGFAKRNTTRLGYTLEEFQTFYRRALDRVFHWDRQGVVIREVYFSVILNKILSTFDAGYVDLQSPTGGGSSVLVYNYDGFVYPSDEARMLAESGDQTLRMGAISESLNRLIESPVRQSLILASLTEKTSGCSSCAYNQFCAPNPVDSQAQFGTLTAPVQITEHCQRHMWLFDMALMLIKTADGDMLDLFFRWSQPIPKGEFA